MSRDRLLGLAGSERGYTLAELLVAAVIFMMIVAGFGSLYLSSMRSIDTGSAQAFVQQQGTELQEEIARQLRPAVAVAFATSGATCAGVAAPRAMAFQITPGAASRDYGGGTSPFRCLYQAIETIGGVTDPFPQLYVCQLAAPSSGFLSDTLGAGCVTGSKRNLLRTDLHQAGRRLGAEMAASTGPALELARLRVANTSFTQVTAVGTDPGTGQPIPAASLSVSYRFDITDGTLFTSQLESGSTAVPGLRFGSNVMLRN